MPAPLWLLAAAAALCCVGPATAHAQAQWTTSPRILPWNNRTVPLLLAPKPLSAANMSWWPHALPTDLHNSYMGTTQQQIIGVPPSWGLGCPTPGSTPPVRAPGAEQHNPKYEREEKLRREQYHPHYTCPPPCPLSQTVSAISLSDNGAPSSSSNSRHPPPPSEATSASTYSSTASTGTPENNKSKHPPYFNQCLHYLMPSVFETLCKKDNQSIYEFGRKVSKLRLPFCCERTVDSVLMASLEEEYDDNNNNVIENERDTFTINNHNNNNARSNTINNKEVPVSRRLLRTFECNRHLEALLSLDQLARKAAHLFDAVLERYDCGQTYSVHFQCEDCKVSRLLSYISLHFLLFK